VRLFTALWPPDDAVAALAADLPGGLHAPPGWRAAAPSTWHLTLAFHGQADPGIHARALESAVRGLVAPRLRLAGAGRFRGVRWAGVDVDPDGGLGDLVAAAGGDRDGFSPHITILRLRIRPGPGADTDPPTPWSGHRGAWWRPAEVLLMASEPARGGSRYHVMHRVPLSSG
jgi:2'-5' RNA ligase